MFRIGLITKIFPNAKFIMTIRDFKDYIKSCYHKWSSQNINIEFPKGTLEKLLNLFAP